jgi:hypothetical protein
MHIAIKEKKYNHGYNIQDLWDVMKRQNLWICSAEEGAKIRQKSLKNLFNKFIVEISKV